MTKQPLVLIGGGGHCRSAIEVIESTGRYTIIAILDIPEKTGSTVMSYTVTGGEELIARYHSENSAFVVTIGFVRNASPRIRAFDKAERAGVDLPVVISPNAVIAHSAKIGKGSMVFHRAVVNACVETGVNTIINTGAIIEHDCRIGDHNHISTGAILNGNCRVGSRVFIGSGTVVKEGISITDDVVIGAGSVITKNIIEPGIYYGIPGKKYG